MERNSRCGYCGNYLTSVDRCKYCHFEYCEELNLKSDDWDILNLDPNVEWEHFQILYRLHSKGIECISADMWYRDGVAYLIGAKGSDDDIANALNIHKECIFNDYEHCWIILNLFMEKCYRKLDDLHKGYDQAVKLGLPTGALNAEIDLLTMLLDDGL